MSASRPLVLLVEDDELVARATVNLLERNQINIVVARDGREALDSLEDAWPDAVLLDLMLPEINGFQFLRAFRELDQRDTPVIVVSSRTDPVNHYWARRLGANEYIEKPASSERMMEAVERGLQSSVGASQF